jgi:multiple sugar transport system permease protein
MTNDTVFFRVLRAAVLGLLCLFVAFPLYVAFTTSATPFNELATSFSWFPAHPSLQAYIDVWNEMPLARYFMNSLIVTVATVVISIPIALAAA